MRVTEKKKKHSWENIFISLNEFFFWNGFFLEWFFLGMFFYLPKLTIFLEIGNSLMRALGRKNTCFFGNARPKSNARAHLKQRKKHSGLMLCLSAIEFRYLPFRLSKNKNNNIYLICFSTLAVLTPWRLCFNMNTSWTTFWTELGSLGS